MEITRGLGGETALFSSTQGPITGYSRLQQAGEPAQSAIEAAAGNPGQMFEDGVPYSIQSGGVGYSVDLSNPMMSSAKGHFAGHSKYGGDDGLLRSDLNQHPSLPLMSAGSSNYTSKTRRRISNIRRGIKRITNRNFKRTSKLRKNIRSTTLKGLKKFNKFNKLNKLKKYVGYKTVKVSLPVPKLRKRFFGGKKSAKLSRKPLSHRLKVLKGLRPPFFANMNGNSNGNRPPHSTNYDWGKNSEHYGKLVYGGCGDCKGTGFSAGNVELSSSSSALASPVPFASY